VPIPCPGDVIASLHAASGATVGAATGSRVAAALLGPILHVAGDAVPHRDIADQRLDAAGGLLALSIVCVRRGLFDAATIGAAASILPDAEHVVRLPRPGGLKLFHDGRGWHREGAFSTAAQLGFAALLLARLLRPRGLARASSAA
jgi:hypothetical protein